ncbi:hypothetical protein C0992_010860 [Termitomyces sp. T32_za158]|nr:hypothetical protein C0992_010860 [Termitomyces sp. T32_za158]
MWEFPMAQPAICKSGVLGHAMLLYIVIDTGQETYDVKTFFPFLNSLVISSAERFPQFLWYTVEACCFPIWQALDCVLYFFPSDFVT